MVSYSTTYLLASRLVVASLPQVPLRGVAAANAIEEGKIDYSIRDICSGLAIGMPPYKKKKKVKSRLQNKCKTKRRKKDLDEIDDDMKPANAEKLLNQPVDYDLPGCGQFYCVCCARYFIEDAALKDHMKSKVHKRRLKDLEIEPYSIRESEAAAGFGSYEQPKRRKIVDPLVATNIHTP